MNIPKTRLCAVAGVGRRTYDYMHNGTTAPQAATLGRLQTALDRLRRGVGGEAYGLAPHAVYKSCMVVAASYMQANATAALDADPGRRATANPEWQRAAEVRRVGYFIANQFLGFKISDLARAAGVTKQAVSTAVRELEWERDREGGNNGQLDRLLSKLEEDFR
ncbi:hypothetical protein GGQ99_000983 [Aminobacter niigataensis]|uniref:Uncharacterized protein n=2 Tax=Aminobacter niigataensis TaxID=83265 RepID=A0ABR6KZQ6_9HYPH|nr:hypothetical protein [Aminobacter niigataensis]